MELRFKQLPHDLGMYQKESRGKFILLVTYVDDLLYTGDDTELLDQFEVDIKEKLEVTINHNVTKFLGLNITQSATSIHLSAAKYTKTLAKKFVVAPINLTTPYRTPPPNHEPDTTPLSIDNHRLYQQQLGCKLFAAVTCRPDLSYVASQLAQNSGLGFESQCVHFGHPSAGGCQRSTGDPRLILRKVTGSLSWGSGLGFESQCVHFGHPSAGGCQRSTGDPRLILRKGYRLVVLGGYGRTNPLLNKPFYPNGPVVGILTLDPVLQAQAPCPTYCTSRVQVIGYMRQPTSSGYGPLGSTDSSEGGAESE
ncbi:unnamed protein product [Closterium sp. NIES-54]